MGGIFQVMRSSFHDYGQHIGWLRSSYAITVIICAITVIASFGLCSSGKIFKIRLRSWFCIFFSLDKNTIMFRRRGHKPLSEQMLVLFTKPFRRHLISIGSYNFHVTCHGWCGVMAPTITTILHCCSVIRSVKWTVKTIKHNSHPMSQEINDIM